MDSRVLDRAVGAARAGRGYLAGVGTSGSLLAVAVLLFVVASAMVAFRGWPHVGAQPSPGEVVVSPRPTAATGSRSSRRLALFIAGARTTGAGAGAGAGAGTRVGLRPGAGRAGAAAPPHSLGRPATASIPATGTPAAGGSAPSCPSGGCASPAQPGSAASGPTQPVQQVIRQTTSALGQAVSGAGKQVGSVTKQTTGAVSGAVQPVSPQVAGVVNHAGTGTAQTATGVTQAIAGALSGLRKH